MRILSLIICAKIVDSAEIGTGAVCPTTTKIVIVGLCLAYAGVATLLVIVILTNSTTPLETTTNNPQCTGICI